MSFKLDSISINLKFFKAQWKPEEDEARVLRDLVDVVRVRRALEANRGRSQEEPVYFLRSILEAREEVQALLKRVPVSASNTRLLVLEVNNHFGSILDAWSGAVVEFHDEAPRPFLDLSPRVQMDVMEQAWPVVEETREQLDLIASELEKSLNL